jgi:hypothetical protein
MGRVPTCFQKWQPNSANPTSQKPVNCLKNIPVPQARALRCGQLNWTKDKRPVPLRLFPLRLFPASLFLFRAQIKRQKACPPASFSCVSFPFQGTNRKPPLHRWTRTNRKACQIVAL